MNKCFEQSLANVKVKSKYLTEPARSLILSGECNTSKSNVAYWLLCLNHLITYYEEELFQNTKLKRKLDMVEIAPIHLRKAYNSSLNRLSDRKSAIESCCNRLVRDSHAM